MTLLNCKQLNIGQFLMPDQIVNEQQRLPESDTNFYIAKKSVIAPTFRGKMTMRHFKLYKVAFQAPR
jgi:agmatine deiminase